MRSFNLNIEKAQSIIKKFLKTSNRPMFVAIDGRSGTGKSTIANELAKRLGGVVILSDDFWVGGTDSEWLARKPKERASLAIDWMRIKSDVLEPLLAGKRASWHPFDWEKGSGLSEKYIHADSKQLIILDGAYSTRPELLDLIDLSILVELTNDFIRRERLVKRESREYMTNWHNIWDSAEDYYFTEIKTRASFDIIIANDLQ
ncbi:MAG: (d)CMP kinase [Candidatus Roizmanbacteria bacterium]|nr:(d)CMP kinase [Candidatus Roizmanbacteria bacterium]